MSEHFFQKNIKTWNVYRLWDLAEFLPVTEANPTSFEEWGMWVWEANTTLGDFANHARKVMEADLSYPIIVSAEGDVMDGSHRLVKAYLTGVPVKMVKFEVTPPPDDTVVNRWWQNVIWWFKSATHNCIIHPIIMFLPDSIGGRLHDRNATWVWKGR